MPRLFSLLPLPLLCTCGRALNKGRMKEGNPGYGLRKVLPLLLLAFSPLLCAQQLPPVFTQTENDQAHRSPMVKTYLTPTRIVWQSDDSGTFIQNAELLLKKSNGQVAVNDPKLLRLISTKEHRPGILLDFGKELNGGVKISMGIKPGKEPVKLRVRFGESAMEAMSDIGGEKNATNEHSLRDFIVEVPWLGSIEVGETGFRFVRIDLVEADINMPLYAVQAAYNPKRQKEYTEVAKRLRRHLPQGNTSKQAAAMMVLAGLADAQQINQEVLKKNGVQNMSTFCGYYILEAMANAGDHAGAMEVIRQYWGAMLDLGATTFWEDFDINDSRNSTPIDALVPADKDDIHGDFGEFCYIGYRHSFCHGWASGPTAWLSQHVLGITLIEGGNAVNINPHLGDLTYAKGTFPTKHGLIRVMHFKTANGEVESIVEVPKGVTIK